MSVSQFKPGDRVRVVDEGLDRLNEIMGVAPEEATNNVGTVAGDGFGGTSIIINFDEGSSAPYPPELLQVIPDDH